MPIEATLQSFETELRGVIDGAETKSAALRAQRDALATQVNDLRSQLTVLDKQIAELEGTDASAARQAVELIAKLKAPSAVPQTLPQRPGQR